MGPIQCASGAVTKGAHPNLEVSMRTLTALSLLLLASPALAAGAQTSFGGALDPVSATLGLGLAGMALWTARGRKAEA